MNYRWHTNIIITLSINICLQYSPTITSHKHYASRMVPRVFQHGERNNYAYTVYLQIHMVCKTYAWLLHWPVSCMYVRTKYVLVLLACESRLVTQLNLSNNAISALGSSQLAKSILIEECISAVGYSHA